MIYEQYGASEVNMFGVNIYYYLVVAIIVFGVPLSQTRYRTRYIILMTALHMYICGARIPYLTGDLIKYNTTFRRIADYGWFDESFFSGGRNFGFAWLEKLVYRMSGGNFQMLLVVIAVVSELLIAVLIYKYSSIAWLSYLMWDTIGFYIFGFSALKQALAMSLLIAAYMALLEDRPVKFTLWTLLAGCVHMPALVFLPAYAISRTRITRLTIFFYTVSVVAIYINRSRIVTMMADVYYDEANFASDTYLGGRFFMMLLILGMGLLIRGTEGKMFSKTFAIIVVAAVLQMFAGYDNIFTRFSDYYFQFIIIYVPMLFVEYDIWGKGIQPLIRLGKKYKTLGIIALTVFAIWFYSSSGYLVVTHTVDDIANYRFYWEVR